MSKNILQYESKVWATADLLIGAGIKQSDFPKYMMPFFGLIMVESRLVREMAKLLEEFGKESIDDFEADELDDFIEEFTDLDLGYNEYVVKKGKSLKDICKNDSTFRSDFKKYLSAYDAPTQGLLGVNVGNEDEKFLNISGIAGMLNKKKILFAFTKAWSEINLISFDNSEITTLEEHIKRKWADISADTAGEQYTPDDIISLIAEIITSKIEGTDAFLTIYDPTCGGGNLLYGVEERINNQFPNRPTATFGEDWNDALYALAKIESRFRHDSHIEYGNSLTGLKFSDKEFDIIVANPPYGVDWKGYKKDIQNDQTQRFVDLPAVSDGQFLFAQHILSQLDNNGLAVVVHNGSTLFSGDAGSGESNIRKYFFDNDWVEAIIQMPTDEFFNTGIYTYLWIFNKNKSVERKDKVILINASEQYEQLKKSRGKKRKQMPMDSRAMIVDTLTQFQDNDFSKVFDKWHFYFNKQSIKLKKLDYLDRTFEDELPMVGNRFDDKLRRAKSRKLKDLVSIVQTKADGDLTRITNFAVTEYDAEKYADLKEYYTLFYKPLVDALDYKEHHLVVTDKKEGVYRYDKEKETLIRGNGEELGRGRIAIKAAYRKSKKGDFITVTAELFPDTKKDYEIIPYSPNAAVNQANIEAFMDKYIFLPFEYLDNIVGVEINFNKVFYKPQVLRPISEIVADLGELEDDLAKLENDLQL